MTEILIIVLIGIMALVCYLAIKYLPEDWPR